MNVKKLKLGNDNELNAASLKSVLWDNLNGLKSGDIQPSQADAMAAQAREILKTVKLELDITKASGAAVTHSLKAFPEK